MPPFNPNVPDINPANTAFWARPIEQPKADISKETLYKGIGKGFDEAVTGVDDFIKHGVIQPIEEKDLGTRRNEFADALNSARAYVNQQYTSGDKPTLMGNGENVPNAVAGVGDKLEMLQNSMNGGHLSETKYMGDVDNYLRRLRTMFPGYRDFIDQEAFRITGVHPANQEIRSAIGDLNRLLAEHGAKKDQIQSELSWASHEGAIPPDVYNDFLERYRKNPGDTGLLDEIRSYINKSRQYITNNKVAEGDYKRHEEDKKQADETAKSGMNTAFSGERELFIDHAEIASGLYKGANMKSWLTDLGNGVVDTSDPNFSASVAKTAQQYRTKIDQLAASWKNYAMKAYPGYSGSGDASVDSIIKSNLQPLEDSYKHLTEGEYSWFTVNQNMAKGLRADANLPLEQKYQQWRAAMTFIKESGAEGLIPKGMYADVGNKIGEIYKFDWAAARGQPGQQSGGDGSVMTMNKAMEDWKAKGATKENYDTLMGWRDDLLNKDTPQGVKENLVKFFYSVPNWENFRKYNFADEGQIYNRLFNELTSKNIAKLPAENYQMYRGAAEAQGDTIFGKNLLTIRGFESGGAGDAKFIWHTEPQSMKNGKMGMLEATGVRVPASLQKAVDNLNDLLMGVKSVYDHDPAKKGTPVEEYLAGLMNEYGVNPKGTGLPEKIYNAAMTAHKPPVTPGEEGGKVKTLEEK